MKEKIYVEIMGIRLGIMADEGEEYVKKVASQVEESISKMLKGQKNCSLVEASLFCAMSYYSSLSESESKLKNLEAQVALYQASVNRLKKENEELQSRINGNED